MPDDHSEVVPLLPIPNRTVKRFCADDSADSRVKVGHRQAIKPETPSQKIGRFFLVKPRELGHMLCFYRGLTIAHFRVKFTFIAVTINKILPINRVQCGCSSMVERQLPKLHTRVRFPSPAPVVLPRWKVSLFHSLTNPQLCQLEATGRPADDMAAVH